MCFYLLFLLKLVQQGSLSGAPIFIGPLTAWDSSHIGTFLALSALAMTIPSFGGGYLTRYIRDRSLVLVTVAMLVGGTFLFIVPQFSGVASQITEWRYFSGFFILYVATILLEGVAMSLMSKVMSPLLTKGFWNAGLLATEAGSIGRLMGNMALMIMGGLFTLDSL